MQIWRFTGIFFVQFLRRRTLRTEASHKLLPRLNPDIRLSCFRQNEKNSNFFRGPIIFVHEHLGLAAYAEELQTKGMMTFIFCCPVEKTSKKSDRTSAGYVTD